LHLEGKNLTGEASQRFVEEFVKLRQENHGGREDGEERGTHFDKNNSGEGHNKNFPNKVQAELDSPSQPTYPFATCLSHIYSHSWSNPRKSWIWVPKGGALVAAKLGLGFPARREEIWRLGGRSRRVVRVVNKQVDDRSFAEVAAMDTTRGFGQGNLGGNSSRLGDRVGPGQFNEERSFERGEGNYRSREREVTRK
jgi:hypothetical protein